MPEPISCRLLLAAWTTVGPWWNHQLTAPWWRLYRNDGDGAGIRHAQGLLRIPSGRVVLVPPWGAIESMAPATSIGHLFLHLDLPGLPANWIRKKFPTPLVLPINAHVDGLLHLGLTQIDQPTGQLMLQAAGALTLSYALHPWRHELTATMRPENILTPAFIRIASSEGFRLTITELAAACDLSPDHFTRRFRRALGETPARWLLRRRLDRAAELLAMSNDSIDEIAENCGFVDRFHFTRAFSTTFGLPPARYRQQHRSPRESSIT